ncbi:unnamed protein product [Sympodiomycopsis kandeliae]
MVLKKCPNPTSPACTSCVWARMGNIDMEARASTYENAQSPTPIYNVKADPKQLVSKVRAKLQALGEEHLQAHVVCSWERESLDLALPYAKAIGVETAADMTPIQLSNAIGMKLGEIEDLISSVFEAVLIAHKGMSRTDPKYLAKRAPFLGVEDDHNKFFIGLNSSSGCDGGPIESGAPNRTVHSPPDFAFYYLL